MSFINELKSKSAVLENKKTKVIEEIKKSFDNFFDSYSFESFLKQKIQEKELKERRVLLMTEFWQYTSGCSTTNFYCAGARWYNPENKEGIDSWDYKGIRLKDINVEVCTYLSSKLKQKMKEMGFDLLSEEDKTNRFGYYERHFYFGW